MKRIIYFIAAMFFACQLHAQKVALKTPSGGEVWPGYSKQRIEWIVVDNVDNIKIEISVDSAKTWQTIVSSYPMSAAYLDITVPAKPSDSCYIKITSTEDATNYSTNYTGKKPFKIPDPYINLEIFTGVEFQNNVHAISWDAAGVKYCKLSVAYDSINFVTIKDSLDATIGYYTWTVPGYFTEKARMRITSYDGNMSQIQEGTFSIRPARVVSAKKYRGGSFDGHSSRSNRNPALQITNTALPDSVNANAVLPIQWTFENTERVDLFYSLDSMKTWKTAISNYPASAATADMNVPDTAAQLFLKLQNVDDSSFKSISKRIIIKDKYLSLEVVNKKIERNVPVELRWVGVGISTVKLSYQRVKTSPVMIKNIPGTQEEYIWQPVNITDSIRFIITDTSNSALTDTSAWFVIRDLPASKTSKYHGGSFDGHSAATNRAGRIKVIQPENVQWNGSFSYNIEWQSDNIEKLNIDYSADSGKTWQVITTGYPASAAKFSWKTPSTPTTKGFVRLTDAADSTVFDRNDTAFSILSKSVIVTKDSMPIKKLQPYQIGWKQSGIEKLKIKYKLGIKASWLLIKDPVDALQEVYNWIVPASVKDTIYVGVNDVTDTTVADSFLLSRTVAEMPKAAATKYHGGSFDGHSMRSSKNIILISKPAPNEIISSGTQYKITWSTVNISDSIIIQYSVDSGATWTTITSQLATNGEYTWIVPNKLNARKGFVFKQNGNGNISSNLCLMRAVDPVSKDVVGVTPKPFTILVPNTKFLNLVKFTYLPDLKENIQMSGIVVAAATAKTKVSFFVKNGNASFNADSLKAGDIGKITIGAYAPGDSTYAASDTVYRDICVQPTAPILSAAGNKVLCAGDSIQLKSVKSYEKYKWSTGDSTNAINITKTGVFKLQVLVNECWSAMSDSLKTYKDTTKLPSISVNGDTVFCAGKSAQLIASAASAYQWLNNDTAIFNAQQKNITITASGNYSVNITTNVGCHFTSASKHIVVNPIPIVSTIQGPAMIPLNDSAMYVSGTAGGTWSSSDASVASINNKGFVTGMKEGKAFIFYSVTNSSGCTAKDSVEVNVSAAAALVKITGTTQICEGDTAGFTSSVGGGIWTTGNSAVLTMNNGIIKAVKAGTTTVIYTVKVNGFTVTRSLIVTVNPLPFVPDIQITGDTVFCEGKSAMLTALTSDKIKWLQNGVVLLSDTATTLTIKKTGNYSYTATTNKGCSAQSKTKLIVVNANPVIGSITGITAVSKGDTIQLHNPVSGGVWSSSSSNVAFVNNIGIVTGVSEGSANIKYTLTNNNGCSAADSLTIIVKPILTVSGASVLCVNDTAAMKANISGGVWSSSDATVLSISPVGIVKAKKAGAVQISYSIVYSGVPVTVKKDIIVNALPDIVIAGAASVNIGDSILLNATPALGAWSSAATNIATVSSQGVVKAKAVGTASISYAVTNNFGCSASSSVNILVKPILILKGKNVLCAFDNTVFTANIAGGSWSSTNAAVASVNTLGAVTANAAGNAAIVYTILYAGNIISDSILLQVNAVPQKPLIYVNGNTLTASVTAASYTWAINGIKDSASGKSITATKSGAYTVTVTNVSGCSAVSNAYPILISANDALQYAPNPSKGDFKLQYIMDEPGLVQIIVRNANGKEVYKKLVQQAAGVYNEQVHLNVLPGLYYIEMKLTKKSYNTTIVIMR